MLTILRNTDRIVQQPKMLNVQGEASAQPAAFTISITATTSKEDILRLRNQQVCPLLKLPRELRDHIYGRVSKRSRDDDDAFAAAWRRESLWHRNRGLLQTSSQLREEFAPVYYAQTNFEMSHWPERKFLAEFLGTVNPAHHHFLDKISLSSHINACLKTQRRVARRICSDHAAIAPGLREGAVWMTVVQHDEQGHPVYSWTNDAWMDHTEGEKEIEECTCSGCKSMRRYGTFDRWSEFRCSASP